MKFQSLVWDWGLSTRTAQTLTETQIDKKIAELAPSCLCIRRRQIIVLSSINSESTVLSFIKTHVGTRVVDGS